MEGDEGEAAGEAVLHELLGGGRAGPRVGAGGRRVRALGVVLCSAHTGEFPRGVGHKVENGWGLTIVAVVLLNGLLW